jgi:hypothetical protein
MKIQNIANPLIASENMSSSIMGMDARGADMATYYLRDKIYSDKILAVVREYACNALDEHKKHKIEQPVRFGLRVGSGEEPSSFFVRDYAKGLSEDDIRNVFGMYFRSTKSGSNDQIGGFGIGSKAGHSYTDTFYVKSFYNGVCSLYACTLGGGNTGVPVGHIFKVSEEPTSETGLEVSLEIKTTTDYAKFSNHCYDFCTFCSQNIILHLNNVEVLPLKPSYEETVSDFKFRFYNDVSDYMNVKIHMGDVCYDKNVFASTYNDICTGKINKNTVMVVEVPMGKMTLPISREGFEVTPANNRVLNELKESIVKIVEKDLAKIKPMSIPELISSKNEYSVIGENFHVYKKDFYPNTHAVTLNIGKLNDNALEKVDGKFVCVLLPNKASSEYWRNKIKEHATANGKNYYYLNEGFLDQCKDRQEVDAFFEFKKVKSSYFGWKKGASKTAVDINTKFAVSGHWSSNHYWDNKSLNALEVHNMSRSALNLPTASTIDEAKKQIKNTNFEERLQLEHFSFYSDHSSAFTNGAKVFFRSKTLKKAMLEIGWLDAAESEYKNKLEIVCKKEKDQAALNNQVQNSCPKFLTDYNSRKIKFSKNPKYAQKAYCIMEKIRQEHSLRSSIIKSLDFGIGHWYNNVFITRSEFRKILKMK